MLYTSAVETSSGRIFYIYFCTLDRWIQLLLSERWIPIVFPIFRIHLLKLTPPTRQHLLTSKLIE